MKLEPMSDGEPVETTLGEQRRLREELDHALAELERVAAQSEFWQLALRALTRELITSNGTRFIRRMLAEVLEEAERDYPPKQGTAMHEDLAAGTLLLPLVELAKTKTGEE